LKRVWLPEPPEALGAPLPDGIVADVWTDGEPLSLVRTWSRALGRR
jgi:hypothetical protein